MRGPLGVLPAARVELRFIANPARGHLLEVRAPAGPTPSLAMGASLPRAQGMHGGFSNRTLSGCHQRPLPGQGQGLVPSPVTPTLPPGWGHLEGRQPDQHLPRNHNPRKWRGAEQGKGREGLPAFEGGHVQGPGADPRPPWVLEVLTSGHLLRGTGVRSQPPVWLLLGPVLSTPRSDAGKVGAE